MQQRTHWLLSNKTQWFDEVFSSKIKSTLRLLVERFLWFSPSFMEAFSFIMPWQNATYFGSASWINTSTKTIPIAWNSRYITCCDFFSISFFLLLKCWTSLWLSHRLWIFDAFTFDTASKPYRFHLKDQGYKRITHREMHHIVENIFNFSHFHVLFIEMVCSVVNINARFGLWAAITSFLGRRVLYSQSHKNVHARWKTFRKWRKWRA